MNDPVGLVYAGGVHHLFYQYNPHGSDWGHMSWGHAVSEDLVAWRELPVALPEAEVAAYSGSAVADVENTSGLGPPGSAPVVVMYTGHHPGGVRQDQRLAYSLDGGFSFTRLPGPVLDIGSDSFRDPKVFRHAPTGRWVMAVAKASENRISLYVSPDLGSWTHASDFGPAGARAPYWECPDMFELPVESGSPGETRWVLAVSVSDGAPAGGSGMQLFTGRFDGERFAADPTTAPVFVDGGGDFYAAQSWSTLAPGDARRVWIAWAGNWAYARRTPADPARGILTLPRALSLRRIDGVLRLIQRPLAEHRTLRGSETHTPALRLSDAPRDGAEVGLSGDQVEIEAELELGSASAVWLTLEDKAGLRARLSVHAPTSSVVLERWSSPDQKLPGFNGRHRAPVRLKDGRVRLHAFFDRSIIEVFADDGEQVLTDRIFRADACARWTFAASGGEAVLRDLRVWPMRAATAPSSPRPPAAPPR